MPLIVALVGILFPNTLFLYWLFFELESAGAFLDNHVAVALFVDAVLVTSLLAYLIAVRPLGRLKWPWLFVLTLIGGLGFGLGILLWVNYRRSAGGHATFASWWRAGGSPAPAERPAELAPAGDAGASPEARR